METKKTLKWQFNTIARGIKTISGAFPVRIFLIQTINAIVTAGIPFINIWFGAAILNELAGTQNTDRLLHLVLLTLGLNLTAQLIQSILRRREAVYSAKYFDLMTNVYADKFLSMDYLDAENPEVLQQHAEIYGYQRGSGFGFNQLFYRFRSTVEGFIRLILSVGFAFSMFTFRVPEDSPYAFLNAPWMMVLIILLLLCIVLLSPFLSLVGGRIWSDNSEENNFLNRIFGFYFDRISNTGESAKDVRIYNQREIILKEVAGFSGSIHTWITRARYFGKFEAAGAVITFLANGLIFLYIAAKAHGGAFGVGSILLYVGAIQQFGTGFQAVMMNLGMLINNNPFLEKIFAFLDIPNKKYQGTIPIEKRDDNDYAIEFHNVSFKYPGSDTYALRNLNLTLKIGTRMAVVGMNGSGKTTMIKLLTRLYDPTEGEITLNGIDIKKYNYDEYMEIFGVVFQDFGLLPFTLGQNVAASVNYDAQRVQHVLTQSGFGERLGTLPDGLDTYLGKDFEETGIEMSGGEKQKIALARALYKNSPFIVLDEPTAALDPIAEYEIYSAFNEIVGDKTAVYISHRLSSCRFCDDIVVFHEGQLVQRGGHETLLADTTEKYHELWHAQAQYYTEE